MMKKDKDKLSVEERLTLYGVRKLCSNSSN